MRVAFMGTPEFSVPALEKLVAVGHEVVCAYTRPPRPAGRGKRERVSPVHRAAMTMGVPVRHPMSLKTPDEQRAFAELRAEVGVVVAYGLILSQAILDAPKQGCLNIHASLLPRWRGAAPIHRAVMAGDDETGVCIMRMEAGLDTGPVLMSASTPIGPQETTGELHDRLARMGADLLGTTLGRLDELTPVPQPEDGVSYARKIDKAEAGIDWTRPAAEIDRQIRGLSPFPGAWTTLHGRRLKLLRSRVSPAEGPPGTVLSGFTVACGGGAADVLEVQAEGRSRQDVIEFLRGTPVEPGTKLGDG